jgi:hypothetical protein
MPGSHAGDAGDPTSALFHRSGRIPRDFSAVKPGIGE